ncbi:hypothetical protein J2Z31_005152 [Sinorhizobium kostiense]|uniref:Uncharacterized protein n=1 Tax=Sinorhizobium kostiense TaxID=76747 RepID=A0ABS4R6U2_9HYPH|nr:hypothetical protein [Sinorhizobium kostiense]MBP2238615.1 hypothetical protein [Sinorhizobium kostiense]
MALALFSMVMFLATAFAAMIALRDEANDPGAVPVEANRPKRK